MKHLKFKGTLSETDKKELTKHGFTFTDTTTPTSGLAALAQGLNEFTTSEQATVSKERITIINPTKTPNSDLLKIVAETHDDEPQKVLIDVDPDTSGHHLTEFEESLKVMEDSGVKVYRDVSQLITEEEKLDQAGGFE